MKKVEYHKLLLIFMLIIPHWAFADISISEESQSILNLVVESVITDSNKCIDPTNNINAPQRLVELNIEENNRFAEEISTRAENYELVSFEISKYSESHIHRVYHFSTHNGFPMILLIIDIIGGNCEYSFGRIVE